MILVTDHAVRHYIGRCEQTLSSEDRYDRKRELAAIVEQCRPATSLEAIVVLGWLNWQSEYNVDNVLVDDATDVAFVVSFETPLPTLMTTLNLPKALLKMRRLSAQRRVGS